MVTVRHIARVANVSPATVSRALSGKGEVAEGTREKVIAVAQQLGYQGKNALELQRSKNATHVAVIFPMERVHYRKLPEFQNISWSFHQEVYGGVEELARKDHCLLQVIMYLYEDDGSNEELPSGIYDKDLQGYIVVGGLIPPRLADFLLETDKPVVSVGTELTPHIDSIMVDNVDAIRQCVQYLYARNRRRIGLINGSMESRINHQKLSGYLSGLIQTGLAVDTDLIRVGGSLRTEWGYEHGCFLLSQGVDAIICAYDALAIGVLTAANDRGVKVPEELEIVGFGDEFSEGSLGALIATFGVPKQRMGRIAYQRLIHRISDPKIEPVRVVLPAKLTRDQQLGARADLGI